MYLDMLKYDIEDLKDEKEKAFIEGHAEALEDLESALDNYLMLVEDDDIEIFSQLRQQIAEDFVNYAREYIQGCNDEMLVTMLDQQGVKES